MIEIPSPLQGVRSPFGERRGLPAGYAAIVDGLGNLLIDSQGRAQIVKLTILEA